jgi:uncharacterized membrane protein YhaH (DUF805 family)
MKQTFDKLLGFDTEVMGRKRFAINYIWISVFVVVVDYFSNVLQTSQYPGSFALMLLYLLIEIVFVFAALYIYGRSLVKRLQSVGWNGKWVWVGIIPFVNFLFILVLLLKPTLPPRQAQNYKEDGVAGGLSRPA